MIEFTEYIIDLTDVYNADELQNIIEEVLPVPGYYGRNLDALFDVLTEEADGWDITFKGCSDAEVTMGKYMRKLRQLCEDAQNMNDRLRVSFED